MRGLGLDVHRDFCEVAIAENDEVRSAGRIATRVDAPEATTGSDKIVSILERHGIRVIVANTRKLKSISDAKAKTDRLDARSLARLLVSGLLDTVWTPDERTRRRVLSRTLCERPPVTDAFGKAGRQWLAALELPLDVRLTLEGCLRQIDSLAGEIAAFDREIARLALQWPEVLRLMTVPGVNVQTAGER